MELKNRYDLPKYIKNVQIKGRLELNNHNCETTVYLLEHYGYMQKVVSSQENRVTILKKSLENISDFPIERSDVELILSKLDGLNEKHNVSKSYYYYKTIVDLIDYAISELSKEENGELIKILLYEKYMSHTQAQNKEAIMKRITAYRTNGKKINVEAYYSYLRYAIYKLDDFIFNERSEKCRVVYNFIEQELRRQNDKQANVQTS